MFEIKSTKLIVTDPCYSVSSISYNLSGLLENVRPGKWDHSLVLRNEGAWGERVSELVILHTEENFDTFKWERQSFEVGVDSGQAGFFEFDHYPQGVSTGEYGEQDTFYDKVCKLTLSPSQGGEIEFGAVSYSGFGDGSYTCFVARNLEGQIIAAKIVFISDEDEDEIDEEDEYAEDCL